MLVEQLEDVLAEADGAHLDADLFAQLSPGDAACTDGARPRVTPTRCRARGRGGWRSRDEPTTEDLEEEILRLQDVIESSRRVQAALERYLALLSRGQPVA